MALEQQVEPNASAMKRKCAIQCPEPANQAQVPRSRGRGLQVFTHHRQHHAPVKPQMQVHADEAPVGA